MAKGEKRGAPKHAREKKLRRDDLARAKPRVTLPAIARFGSHDPDHLGEITDLERRQASADRIRAAREPAAVPDETPKQRRVRERAEKAERAAAASIDDRRRMLSSAGLDVVPGTAQFDRDIDVVSVVDQGKYIRRASVGHLNQCLRKQERSNPRILAWDRFYHLQSRIHASAIAPPRFEPGVDSSKLPTVDLDRLDATNEEQQQILPEVGRAGLFLLVEVIFHGKRYREVDGYEERLAAGMFKRALDQLAFHYRFGPDPQARQAA